eukprot:2275238-Amphidinium_carterae.1
MQSAGIAKPSLATIQRSEAMNNAGTVGRNVLAHTHTHARSCECNLTVTKISARSGSAGCAC